MHKLLLITAITAINFSTIAQHLETGHPYVKAHIGITKAQNTTDVTSSSYNSNVNAVGVIAFGYNIKDNIRADLSYDHYINTRFSTDNPFLKVSVRLKTSSLLLNFYIDVAEVHGYKVFLGAGSGMSRFSVQGEGLDKSSNQSFPIRYKQHNVFAYGLYAGTHYELKPGIHGELMYSYKNLGIITDSKYKVHNITAGIRFDI
ncbi:MAG: porin family protein [Rickettsiaceae bacterium]|nr:porin family protein [Rickettsiaceae bacterium]